MTRRGLSVPLRGGRAGLPQIDMIEGDEEYEIAADRFDEWLDEQEFDDMDD